MRDRKTEKHGTYGQISLNRTTHGAGGTRLFGSSLPGHAATISLEINAAEMHFADGEEHIFGREQIVRVSLSAAQFADLIANMNTSGVPCTIRRRWVGGRYESMGDVPEVETEAKKVLSGFDEHVGKVTERMRGYADSILSTLPKSLGKPTRRQVEIELECIVREGVSSAPFYLEQFERAARRRVVAAKAEVEAFTTLLVQRAGIKALDGGMDVAGLLSDDDDAG